VFGTDGLIAVGTPVIRDIATDIARELKLLVWEIIFFLLHFYHQKIELKIKLTK